MARRTRYTVAEFAELHGWNEEFVRQMCRKQFDPRTGNNYSLPEGWQAEKVGRDWFIQRIDTRASSLKYSVASQPLRVAEGQASAWEPFFRACQEAAAEVQGPITVEISVTASALSMALQKPADSKLEKRLKKLFPR